MRRVLLITGALLGSLLVGAPAAAIAPADPGPAFCDVDDEYFAVPVAWAKASGITSGVSSSRFDPHGSTTRGQLVTLLHRFASHYAAAPAASGTHSFSDIPSDAYYGDAVAWAAANGITTGMGGSRFAPDETTTRAQLATFVHRLEERPAAASLDSFGDVDPNTWFAEAVNWMAEAGLTTGTSANTFSPHASASRAQVVTFLWRMAGEPEPGDYSPAPCPRTFTVIGDSVVGGTRVGQILTGDSFAGWDGVIDARGCRQPLITAQDTVCGKSPVPSALLTIETAAAAGTLPDVLVIHTGTNGRLDADALDQILAAASSVDTIWLMNIRSPWSNQIVENAAIDAAAERWSATADVRVLDWAHVVDTTPGLLSDSIHLTPAGRVAVRDLIGSALAAS